MFWNQTGWRFCFKCQAVFFGPASAGMCPADRRAHDPSHSGEYVIADLNGTVRYARGSGADPTGYGDSTWRFCRKCHCLFDYAFARVCATDGRPHDFATSGEYVIPRGDSQVPNGVLHYQDSWRRCGHCGGLWFIGNRTDGVCPQNPAGHVVDAAGPAYRMVFAGPLETAGRCRLLVVAPPSFLPLLQPLIDHKNRTEMPAAALDLHAATAYYAGRDDAERLKAALTYAAEYAGVSYVLLVGDASVMPVRYRYIHFSGGWRTGVYAPTDLYYANLYMGHSIPFRATTPQHLGPSDWDADHDGNFNRQDWDDTAWVTNPDEVSGYVDLAVGRLPTSDDDEIRRYVLKVIDYETGQATNSAFACTVVVDANYPTATNLAADVSRHVPLTAARWQPIDRVGFQFAASDARAAEFRLPGLDTLADLAARSSLLFYIGHGAHDGWDIPGAQADDVRRVRGAHNVSIVYAAGCSTGQLATFAPDGPTRYTDTDGRSHWYWQLPVGSASPDRTVDFEGNDPRGGNGMAGPTIQRGADGTVPAITPEKPGVYQPDCLTVARQWLTSSADSGAVVYFGEQTVAPDDSGCSLGTSLLTALSGADPAADVIGDAWLAACRRYYQLYYATNDRIANARIYLSYMTLYGDPSVRVQLPNFPPVPARPSGGRWLDAFGAITTSPAIARNLSGRLEIVGQGLDSRPWHEWQDGAGGSWVGEWHPLGSEIRVLGRPSIVANADGRLEVFARGEDGGVHHCWQGSADNEWGDWAGLGGGPGSVPVAAANADGHLEVFIRCDDPSDGPRLQHRWVTGVGWWPGADSWADLGKPPGDARLTGAPAVGRNIDGRLEVFCRTDDGAVWHIWQNAPNGLWDDWSRLGEDADLVAGAPAVASTTDGRLVVVARGTDGNVTCAAELPGGGWSSWTPSALSVLPASELAMTSTPDGLALFAAGSAGDVVWAREAAIPAHWTVQPSLGGYCTGALVAATDTAARLHVFAQSVGQRLWRLQI